MYRMSELTAEYLDKKLGEQTEILKSYVDVKTQYLDSRIDKIETSVDRLETSVDRLETSVGKLETSVDGIETSVGKLEMSIDRLESSLEEKIDDLARMTARGFEEIRRELDVRGQVQDLDKRIGKVEHALNIRN